MKYEISYEKNNVPQAVIMDGPDATTCETYFKATRSYSVFYGVSIPDAVKPGQPVISVPDGWTVANNTTTKDASNPCKWSASCGACSHCDTCTNCSNYVTTETIPEDVNPIEIAPHLHISEGNTKLGRISNMSLTPGVSCSRIACETCHVDGCYACDSYNRYPNVRNAWDENTRMALFALDEMESGLRDYFDGMNAPRFFRIHVGGDFITRAYTKMWYRIAQSHPHTHFLAFTKQWDMIRPYPFYNLPNFTLRLSDWPGTEIPADLQKHYHVAWLDDETRPESAFPVDCITCPGHCETCGKCWNEDHDTIFHKHGSQAKKKKEKKQAVKDRYEIRQIDAIAYDGEWTYNDSFPMGDFTTSAKNVSKAFRKALGNMGVTFKKGTTRTVDNGNYLEIIESKTSRPLFSADRIEK